MDDWIEMTADPRSVAKEREKARELRKSSWWKEQLAKGVCYYCGGHFQPAELTMDHIVPVARGGRSTRGNVVCACKPCNASKRYLTPVEQIMRDLEQNDR
jgi:5-methylcytosine-specific restriction endonuclease McrA